MTLRNNHHTGGPVLSSYVSVRFSVCLLFSLLIDDVTLNKIIRRYGCVYIQDTPIGKYLNLVVNHRHKCGELMEPYIETG